MAGGAKQMKDAATRGRCCGDKEYHRLLKPQYHFFYGSLSSGCGQDDNGDDDDDENGRTTSEKQPQQQQRQQQLHLPANEVDVSSSRSFSPILRAAAAAAAAADEQESLDGEHILPTDTEEDDLDDNDDDEVEGEALSSGEEGLQTLLMIQSRLHIIQHSERSTEQCRRNNHHSTTFLLWPWRFWRQCQREQQQWKETFVYQSPICYSVFFVTTATVILMILLGLFTIFVAPNLNNSSSSFKDATASYRIPFPIVDRAQFRDAVEDFLNLKLFHPSLINSGGEDNNNNNLQGRRPQFAFPFPTGAFWTNLVVFPPPKKSSPAIRQKDDDDESLSYPIVVYPYAYKWSDTHLQVSYPAQHRSLDSNNNSIHDHFVADLLFGCSESHTNRYVTSFDPLSVTLRFETAGSNGPGSYEVYLVQGSPYVTIRYNNASPMIEALKPLKGFTCPRADDEYRAAVDGKNISNNNNNRNGHRTFRKRRLNYGVCYTSKNVPGKYQYRKTEQLTGGDQHSQSTSPFAAATTKTRRHGVQFILQSDESMTWIIFMSDPISFDYDTQNRTYVSSPASFTGVMRLALIPQPEKVLRSKSASTLSSNQSSLLEEASEVDVTASTGLQRLINHAEVYPIGADVSISFQASLLHSTPIVPVHATRRVIRWMKNLFRKISADASPSPPFQPGTHSINNSEKLSSTSGRVALFSFQFKTKTFATAGSSSTDPSNEDPLLLMLALPHHTQSVPNKANVQSKPQQLLTSRMFDLTFQTIKGPMQAFLGSSWSFVEYLATAGFDDFDTRNISLHNTSCVEQAPTLRNKCVFSLIAETLNSDTELIASNQSLYAFAKQVARLAQLAHVSDVLHLTGQLNQTDFDSDDNVVMLDWMEDLEHLSTKVTRRLSAVLLRFLTTVDKTEDYSVCLDSVGRMPSFALVYDASLGGLSISEGICHPKSQNGHGRYADHHVVYGYILYACAVLGRLDPEFVRTYGYRVDSMLYDITAATIPTLRESNVFVLAGSSTMVAQHRGWHRKTGVPSLFPVARHKSWFDGHSFASGLFPVSSAKSTISSSSSETVNGYYGAYLWSLVRHGAISDAEMDTTAQTDFVRLLLAMEIRGMKTYWQLEPLISDVCTRVSTNQASNGVSRLKNNSGTVSSGMGRTSASDDFPALCEGHHVFVKDLGMLDVETAEVPTHGNNSTPITGTTATWLYYDFISKE